MGDYEDRYPEAYGRGDDARLPVADELKLAQTPRQTRDNQTRDKLAAGLRRRIGLGAPTAPGPAPADTWQHAPESASEAVATVEPVPPSSAGSFRGFGPRGYVRSSARIYEDVCDRLTENPFVDATDIDVAVTGVEVTLRAPSTASTPRGRRKRLRRRRSVSHRYATS